MATKYVIKLSAIMSFFNDDNKSVSRGENALESGHVVKMDFNSDLYMLKGEVHASMKNRTYKVEIDFNDNGDIVAAKCNCPKGIKCHHIAAMLLFGHHNISITDQACKWNVPKKKPDEIAVTCEDMFPSKPYTAIDRVVSSDEVKNLREKLHGINIGVAWLLKEEPTEELHLPVPLVERVIFNKDYFNAANKHEYLLNLLQVTEDTIKKVAHETTGQSENEKWMLIRKHRLTASNFAVILNACRRNRFPPSLFKRLHGVYNLDGVKSIQWGKTHEKEAIQEFSAVTSLPVTPTGLWLHRSGFLGASPDGLIQDDAVLEVKCPFTYRNDRLTEVLKTHKKYIIYFDDNDELCVNKTHDYYDQIQGLLHILNRSICYLMIWSMKESVITKINKDEEWKVNINYLEKFYIRHYVNTLLQNID